MASLSFFPYHYFLVELYLLIDIRYEKRVYVRLELREVFRIAVVSDLLHRTVQNSRKLFV